jgi:hypothetical protein
MLREYKIIRTSSVIWFTIRHRQQISVVEIESVFSGGAALKETRLVLVSA